MVIFFQEKQKEKAEVIIFNFTFDDLPEKLLIYMHTST